MSMTATGLNLRPVLPPVIQTQLGLRDPRFRPLSDVKTVLRDLGEYDIDAEQVRDLVEQQVLIGFNIAVDDLGKSELRILTKSIEFFRATKGRKYHELEWPQIFRQIVPHQKPIVTGLEIRRSLLCDRGHVENLINGKRLVALKKSQPGPGGSWTVSRESYENFLKGRMQ
jgi:hypothetical protein